MPSHLQRFCGLHYFVKVSYIGALNLILVRFCFYTQIGKIVKITSVSKSPPPPYSKFICGIIFRCSYTLRTTPLNEIIDAAVYISTNVPKGSPKVLDQYIKKKKKYWIKTICFLRTNMHTFVPLSSDDSGTRSSGHIEKRANMHGECLISGKIQAL
jgi:hypothetical protein